MRCQYCDTAYAFHGGENVQLSRLLEQISTYGVPHVCVTGGEPLAQRASLLLLSSLCDAGYSVSLETSGAVDASGVDRRVSRILDIKTPGSGEVARNLWPNLETLRSHDEIKFVICDRADFDWATQVTRERALAERCGVLFSPSHQQLAAAQLADWIIAERPPVRFQMQLHKTLWGNVPGR